MIPPQSSSFHGLGIAPKILDILTRNNYIVPTPIQQQSIPHALEGKDLMGIAQTGTGKTLAFGIPMLQRLVQAKGLGLIIVPTRELALQVDEAIQKIGRQLGLKTVVLIGGEPIFRQIKRIQANPHIIIATPGRLIDHLEQRTVRLDAVKILVLDEADRMLDMGFAPQVNKILARVPSEKQTMLFSATMPKEIVAIAAKYMKLPIRVEVAPSGTAAKDVTQELFFVDKPNKVSLLIKILSEYRGSVLIFTRTKYEAKRIASKIRDNGHNASEIHSNRSLSQRREALQGFRIGKYRILVATDIAARGIDVSGIELVINYDLPDNPEDYVHRIGRTGRAGSVGHAISFAAPHQRGGVRSIERLIRQNLPVSQTPNTPPLRTASSSENAEEKRRWTPRRNFSHRNNHQRRNSGNF
ncbi:DEAD/DEAH box helicase [Candidatus Peregrinibacteria bacterium]|nr:DEAD/DEAH box helicase [Candidatus Peregrinibacteria bacterium]